MSSISIATDRSLSRTIPDSLTRLLRRVTAFCRLTRYPAARRERRRHAMRWLGTYASHSSGR